MATDLAAGAPGKNYKTGTSRQCARHTFSTVNLIFESGSLTQGSVSLDLIAACEHNMPATDKQDMYGGRL